MYFVSKIYLNEWYIKCVCGDEFLKLVCEDFMCMHSEINLYSSMTLISGTIIDDVREWKEKWSMVRPT